MTGLPETPEGVALYLLTLLLKEQPVTDPTQTLNLYVECLNAAIGFRPKINTDHLLALH